MGAAAVPVMIAASVGQTILGYNRANSQAKSAQSQANYEAQLLDQNAGYADAQAADSISRGHEADLQQYASGRQLIGAQRAALGASGVQLDVGSARDVVTSDEALNEVDRATIRNNAAREALGYTQQAASYRGQAGLTRLGSANTAKAYRRQGVSTLLAGAGDLFNIYQSFGLNRAPRTTAGATQLGNTAPYFPDN